MDESIFATVFLSCSLTAKFFIMNREELFPYFITGQNYFVMTRGHIFDNAFWHNIVYFHFWLADAQVAAAHHPFAGSATNLDDLSLRGLDEGLHRNPATQAFIHQVAVTRGRVIIATYGLKGSNLISAITASIVWSFFCQQAHPLWECACWQICRIYLQGSPAGRAEGWRRRDPPRKRCLFPHGWGGKRRRRWGERRSSFRTEGWETREKLLKRLKGWCRDLLLHPLTVFVELTLLSQTHVCETDVLRKTATSYSLWGGGRVPTTTHCFNTLWVDISLWFLGVFWGFFF